MKKYIVLMAAALVSFASCSVYTDVEAGGTAIEEMAGTWTVTFEQSVDEYYYIFGYSDVNPNMESMSETELEAYDGWDYIYGDDKYELLTSNTASNSSTEMLFIDNEFWGTTVKCSIDYDAMTFECIDAEPYDGCVMNIKYGKIVKDGAVTPSGRIKDSITAYVTYSDDYYGFTVMKLSGYRYTGYTEDLY